MLAARIKTSKVLVVQSFVYSPAAYDMTYIYKLLSFCVLGSLMYLQLCRNRCKSYDCSVTYFCNYVNEVTGRPTPGTCIRWSSRSRCPCILCPSPWIDSPGSLLQCQRSQRSQRSKLHSTPYIFRFHPIHRMVRHGEHQTKDLEVGIPQLNIIPARFY